MKKIVAIGGGENGRIKSDGTKLPYELKEQDEEIIRLTGKEHPHFLFIGHSLPLEYQQGYFETMTNIYEKMYGCECKDLKSNELTDIQKVKELVEWSDIIYEGGGNTLDMIALWKKTGFDKILLNAYENGKVMCGVSAGANCWFKECSSDSLQIKYGKDQPLIKVECLGFVNGLYVPHCDAEGRLESAKELLKDSNQIGLLVSNCTALEIIDNNYRLITSKKAENNFAPYALKAYWSNGEFLVENIEISKEYKSFDELLIVHSR